MCIKLQMNFHHLTLELSGMFDLKPMRTFPLGPQTWLVNPVIDQRAKKDRI